MKDTEWMETHLDIGRQMSFKHWAIAPDTSPRAA